MNHEAVLDLLPAFALGALEEHEQEALLGHIQACNSCHAQARQYVEVSALLSNAISDVQAPEGLRAQVADSIAELSVREPAEVSWLRRVWSPSPQPVFMGMAAVAALALLIVAVVFVVISQNDLSDLQQENRLLAVRSDDQSEILETSLKDLSRLSEENEVLAEKLDDQGRELARSSETLTELQQQSEALTAKVDTQRVFTYLQALPVTNKYVLKATPAAPGPWGMLVTNVANSWGVAILLGLEPLESGMAYQIWLERDGAATSAGVIETVEPESGYGELYTKFPEPVGSFDRIFVTQEPVAGSPVPTGAALLSASIAK